MEVSFTDIRTQSIIAGLITALVYLIARRTKATMQDCIAVLINGAGIWSGLRLTAFCINKFACESESLEESRLVMIAGSIAMIWICCVSIKNKISPPTI